MTTHPKAAPAQPATAALIHIDENSARSAMSKPKTIAEIKIAHTLTGPLCFEGGVFMASAAA
jgi:type IV secretory pathway VirB2 component (pilin)